MPVLVKKVTLTPSQIYGIFAVPIDLLDAPPSGYANIILSITQRMIFNTLAYVGASSIIYFNGSDDFFFAYQDSIMLGADYDLTLTPLKWDGASLPFIITQALSISTDATASVGNSSIDVYIAYEQRLLTG